MIDELDTHYRNIVGLTPVLSDKEELELFKQYLNSSNEKKKIIRDRIISSNLRLVVKIAGKYSKKCDKLIGFNDLVSFGIVGLIKAVDRFELAKECKFSTYASYWINQGILNGLNSLRGDVTFSTDFLSKQKLYLKIKRDYIRKNETIPSYDYMKQKMNEELKENFNDKKLNELIDLIELYSLDYCTSLYSPINDDENICFQEVIPDNSISLEQQHDNNELSLIYENIFDTIGLNKRDKRIIYYRFGLHGLPKLTYKEIANIVGVSHQRVKQIENRALRLISQNTDCLYMLSGYHR